MTAPERLGAMEELAEFQSAVKSELSHMTQQLWMPHEGTDDAIWRQGESIGTGVPVPSLNFEGNNSSLSDEVESIAQEHAAFLEIEAIQTGMVALFLMACRHHRLPLPPHLWFGKALEAKMEAGIDGIAADMPS